MFMVTFYRLLDKNRNTGSCTLIIFFLDFILLQKDKESSVEL